MKPKKIIILEKILKLMATAVIRIKNPKIIGITGSVGKTSAKEAIYHVLSLKYRVRRNEKNYNNEIGLPLTVIGAESGNSSIWKWMKVFFKWLAAIFIPTAYPEILVLEMGVDRPGDMKYLLSFIPVTIGVVTSISQVHMENFKSVSHIGKEKGKMIEALPENGLAVLNLEDEQFLALKDRTAAQTITFGFSEKADVWASDISYMDENGIPSGISFKLNYMGKSIPVRLNKIVAKHQLNSILAAIAVGIGLKINLIDITSCFTDFSLPAGRMNLIPGINGSLIIDDSYNSSPKAAVAALDFLSKAGSGRKIAVLGDMLELGSEEENSHREVARKIYEASTGLFFAVGDRMKIAADELEKLEYPREKIKLFANPSEARENLAKIISDGDIILVKGSQSMRMEKTVEKIIEDAKKARNILCRQSEIWWKKPYIKP